MATVYDFTLPKLGGGELKLADFQDTVLLIVNVASQCGLTPQYSKLEALQQRYGDRGFTVIGVPCNQFMGQEPGNDEQIQEFCTTQYGISFPMSGKIDVNGDNRHALYQWLTDEHEGIPGDIEWNFAKFLVNQYGDVVNRFHPQTEPDDEEVIGAIEACL